MRTIEKIITNVSTSRGAPMGRRNIGEYPGPYAKVYDCYVLMDGAYDKGGAYWGLGARLRVQYTKDLSYVHFYRVGDPVPRALNNDYGCVFVLLANGDIAIYLTDKELLGADISDEMAVYEMLDNALLLGNGWSTYDPADGGHLTECVMITDGTDFWYFDVYQIWGVYEWLITLDKPLILTKL
jgi:hypothetical protein